MIGDQCSIIPLCVYQAPPQTSSKYTKRTSSFGSLVNLTRRGSFIDVAKDFVKDKGEGRSVDVGKVEKCVGVYVVLLCLYMAVTFNRYKFLSFSIFWP